MHKASAGIRSAKSLSIDSIVVWEIFDGKNISWVLPTHKKYLHEKMLPR